MRTRRILLVCGEYPPLVGGIASLAEVVARELEARPEVELHLVGPVGSVETAPGRTSARLARPRGALTTVAAHLLNAFVVRRSADVAGVDEVVFMDAAARARAFPLIRRVRTTIYVHGTELLAPTRVGELISRRVALQRRALRRADRVLANSRATADLVERTVPGIPAEVLHPCFDPARVYRPDQHAQSPYPDPAGTLILLTVARLVPRKGHDLVLRALLRVRDRLPRFRYYIVGDGPARTDLERLARRTGLGDRVVFTGRVATAELGAYYHHADLFVMLSRRAPDGIEGFGLTYVEAGLSGTASVASSRDGAAEAVRHGITGITADPDRVDECAAAILSLAQDPDLRSRYASAAAEWAAQELSPRAFVDRLLGRHS
jgi:phosphatidylinositol alpha-1,6-mannosyltransferase